MRLASVDLNLLIVLDAILREASVTGAARRIGLSQSATSHALARLRDILEDPILLRTSKGMVPTAKAAALTDQVRALLEDAATVFGDERTFDPSSSQERFRIGLDQSAQVSLLPLLIRDLAKVAPGVSLVVPVGTQPDQIVREFERGTVDLAVSSYHPADIPSLSSRFLISAEYVTVGRRGHPLFEGPLTLEDFVSAQHIRVAHPSMSDEAIDGALAEHGLDRKVVLTVSEPVTIPKVVARSDLVATIPKMLIDLWMPGHRLTWCRPPISVAPVPVYLIHHERIDDSPPHHWLRGRIESAFDGLGHGES
ncbi:MAG: LysR family transcriptional regulator [bacterium]|nr:LysR family transcriptional regulator [bacterium]